MSSRDDYVKKMHEMLDKLNAEIDALAEKAEHAQADVRDEYREQVADLRARQDRARDRLASLRDAGEEAWQDLKSGVDMAKDAIREAVDSARSRFNR